MNLKHILITRPEIQNKLFNKVIGKNGRTYLYNGNPSSIYVESDNKGMSGRTVSYAIAEGETLELEGPWHTNTRELFEQTGIDLENMFYSFGLVFKTREEALDFQAGKDVRPLFFENEWKLGSFNGAEDRIKNHLAKVGHSIVTINSLGSVSITTY